MTVAIDPIDRFASLSNRQRETIDGLMLGKTCAEIADELGVSVKTIDTNRLLALRKLGVKNVVQALRLALSCGYTTLDVQP